MKDSTSVADYDGSSSAQIQMTELTDRTEDTMSPLKPGSV